MASNNDTPRMVLAEDDCPQQGIPADISLDTKLCELTVGQWLELLHYASVMYPTARTPEEPPKVAEDGERPLRIIFDYDYITKKEIYAMLVQIIQKQGFRTPTMDVVRFLARYTNLGHEKAIHALIYRYKKIVL